MNKRADHDRGVALVQVLLITAILASFATHLALTSKEQVTRAQLLADRAEADLAAQSQEAALLYSLLTEPLVTRRRAAAAAPANSAGGQAENPYAHAWNFLGEPFAVGAAVLSIRDENGRMAVPLYASGAFERLLIVLGVDAGRARRIGAALLERQGLVAAERLGSSAGAFPLQSLRELRELPEMDDALYARLVPLLTLFPTSGFNPLTAPLPLLRARLTDMQLAGVLELRAAEALDAIQLWRSTGIEADDFTTLQPGPGLTLAIKTSVRTASAERSLTAVVQPYGAEPVTVWSRQ